MAKPAITPENTPFATPPVDETTGELITPNSAAVQVSGGPTPANTDSTPKKVFSISTVLIN